jgi:hypothetical protein
MGRISSSSRIKNFTLLHCVQIGSGTNQTSYKVCTWVLSLKEQQPERESDH